jgi:Glu-tRNA(Gln) amidotransferase subunit E-like FAD-binding protein
MHGITQQELEVLCNEVCREAPTLLAGVTDEGQRSERVLRALHDKVCKHLNLDPEEQAKGLGNSPGFLLM